MPIDDFPKHGFLGENIAEGIPDVRSENAAWFQMAEDTNATLMRVALMAMDAHQAKGANWSKEAVAVRLLLRTATSLQGVVLLAERGMAVQARMLVRSIVEDSFYAGALTTKPDEVIKMLRDGSEASRLAQAKFLAAEKLGFNHDVLLKLDASIDRMDKKAAYLKPRKVAGLSSLLPQYLNYMRFIR